MHTLSCLNCPNLFSASRSDATYCSDSCRTAARRARDRRDLARVVGALRRLSDEILESPDVMPESLVALARDGRRASGSQP